MTSRPVAIVDLTLDRLGSLARQIDAAFDVLIVDNTSSMSSRSSSGRRGSQIRPQGGSLRLDGQR